MTRILLVFTGGTIGSQAENGNINLDPQASFKLLNLFKTHFQDATQISFKTLQPLQILSENLHPHHWQTLIDAIEAEDLAEYDGIIVTHGTDTLAFSAAALSLYFHRLAKPLLMVSSNLPLEHPKANGLANFICAVEFIRKQAETGVFVAYQNPGQTMLIHHGSRLLSCLPLSSDFISINSEAYLEFINQNFQLIKQIATPPISKPQALKAHFTQRILLIRPYPGLDYRQFNLDQTDLVLHDLYHSGTACSASSLGQSHNLLELIQRCQNLNLPIYLSPALYSDDAYHSTRQLLAAGAKMLWNLSLEATYAKLLLAYGNFSTSEQIDQFLQTNLAGEQILVKRAG